MLWLICLIFFLYICNIYFCGFLYGRGWSCRLYIKKKHDCWLNTDRTCRTTLHYYTRLTALFPGLPRWAGTRKVKPIWILLKQETVSGSGISWAICKSAPRSRQITTPAPHHSVFFTGRMPFLPPNQQRQSTEGNIEGAITREYPGLYSENCYIICNCNCGC